MESSTAIGLLVGGAILILATKPRPVAGAPLPAPAPGGNWNPLNWFSGSSSDPFSNIFGAEQPAQLPAPVYQPSNNVYSPGNAPAIDYAQYGSYAYPGAGGSTAYAIGDGAASDPYSAWASNDFNGPPPAYTETYKYY